MSAPVAGYSGTPLAKKLGIVEGSRLLLRHAPPELMQWLAPLPPGVVFAKALSERVDIVHGFFDRRATLAAELSDLRESMRADAAIWVSWPKKASGLATDLGEDTIRELALPLGLVDVKVCAVSPVWSGLKLVIRRELR